MCNRRLKRRVDHALCTQEGITKKYYQDRLHKAAPEKKGRI